MNAPIKVEEIARAVRRPRQPGCSSANSCCKNREQGQGLRRRVIFGTTSAAVLAAGSSAVIIPSPEDRSQAGLSLDRLLGG